MFYIERASCDPWLHPYATLRTLASIPGAGNPDNRFFRKSSLLGQVDGDSYCSIGFDLDHSEEDLCCYDFLLVLPGGSRVQSA